ncbi:hypothetical protein [Cognatitamlana onchidii]|nr:hypothetical protein [Algibacter onchidii]
MKATLKYKFKRQSNNFLEWLVYTVKSEKYYLSEGSAINFKQRMNIY